MTGGSGVTAINLRSPVCRTEVTVISSPRIVTKLEGGPRVRGANAVPGAQWVRRRAAAVHWRGGDVGWPNGSAAGGFLGTRSPGLGLLLSLGSAPGGVRSPSVPSSLGSWRCWEDPPRDRQTRQRFQKCRTDALLPEGEYLKDVLKPPNLCPPGASRESKVFGDSL